MTVNIVNPGTMYGERSNQVGLRLAKILRVDRVRTTASLDVYNLFNAAAVLTQNNAFTTLLRPQSIRNPRLAKVVLTAASSPRPSAPASGSPSRAATPPAR